MILWLSESKPVAMKFALPLAQWPLLPLWPAYATTLGQAGYTVKTLTVISFKKSSQLVGYNKNYSLKIDAKIAAEHAKRALKVASYAVASTIFSALGGGLVASATDDQAIPPTSTVWLKKWYNTKKAKVIAGATTYKLWATRYPKTAAAATAALATMAGAAAYGVYLHKFSEAITAERAKLITALADTT